LYLTTFMKKIFSCLVLVLTAGCPVVFAVVMKPPRGLAMTANSPDSITLQWYRPTPEEAAGPEGVQGYRVYRSDRTDGTFSRIGEVKERTFTDSKLAPGTTYYYKVSTTNAEGEGSQSPAAMGFTIAPWEPKPFPVKVARNMCVTLGSTIISNTKPLSGKLENLVDGSDATACRLRKACEIKIKLDPKIDIKDAAYLLLHFRTDCGTKEWANDKFAVALKNYVVVESLDSTDGTDGTWTEVAAGTNALLDGVIVFPNHQPKWVGLRSSGGPDIPADDHRPMPSDLLLCRLDLFRAAPEGYRNDYWIFTGDSLVVGDMPGGPIEGRTAWFSDLIRKEHPDRYPIVVHAARGGEMMKDTLPRMEKIIDVLSPDNGTAVPTATIVCWESGFNDVGVGGSLGLGQRMIEKYEEAKKFCEGKGLVFVPVRIEFSTQFLNKETLEPEKNDVFFNTLAVNLGGVDVFARKSAPYACDPQTNLPYADYWSYTRANYATALVKDGVHHTPSGADGINRLWADVAGKMLYNGN